LLYWPENDTVCGPGTYNLLSVHRHLEQRAAFRWDALPASCCSTRSDPGRRVPVTSGGFLSTRTRPRVRSLRRLATRALPRVWPRPGPSTRPRGAGSPWCSTAASHANWSDPLDGVPNHVPVTGSAQAVGAFLSTDGGYTWTPDLPFASFQLAAVETHAVQTGLPSQTETPSVTPSSTQSASQTQTPSSTASDSQTGTASQTLTASPNAVAQQH